MDKHPAPLRPRSIPSRTRSALALPLALTALTVLLAACGPEGGPVDTSAAAPTTVAAPRAPTAAAAQPAGQPGVVTAVVPLVTQDDATGAGAVVGGVLGAAVGNQIGDGNGRKVATVLGALGGAKVGHEVEKRRSERVTGYRIDVQLDNGGTHSVTLAGTPGFNAGQRVRVVDGRLVPA